MLSHIAEPASLLRVKTIPLYIAVELLSLVQLFVTPWTVVCQAPLSMGFSRQEYWSGLPFPTTRDLPSPGLDLHLLHRQADSLPLVPELTLIMSLKAPSPNTLTLGLNA